MFVCCLFVCLLVSYVGGCAYDGWWSTRYLAKSQISKLDASRSQFDLACRSFVDHFNSPALFIRLNDLFVWFICCVRFTCLVILFLSFMLFVVSVCCNCFAACIVFVITFVLFVLFVQAVLRGLLVLLVSFCLFVCRFVCLFVCLFVCVSVCFVYLFVYLFILFVCFVCLVYCVLLSFVLLLFLIAYLFVCWLVMWGAWRMPGREVLGI